MSAKFEIPTLTPLQRYAVLTALKLVGVAAAAHGLTRLSTFVNASDTIELSVGLVAAIIGLIGGYKSNTVKGVQQAAADTLPPGTVLPATTDESPKATVMSPEGATEFIRKSPPPIQ
jgi:hypothetical protein